MPRYPAGMSVPRRKQPSITIRSARAVALLRGLTRNGRSQAQIIEEALERMSQPVAPIDDIDAFRGEIRAIQEMAAKEPFRHNDMAEFDRQEYDERGLPR